jgi:hypothetical protein
MGLACQSISDLDFLLEEMFEWFDEDGSVGSFLETLEQYIPEDTITIVPPGVIKSMVTYYVSKDYLVGGEVGNEIYGVHALKMFPYLSYTLTEWIYPTGDFLDDKKAPQAKAGIYFVRLRRKRAISRASDSRTYPPFAYMCRFHVLLPWPNLYIQSRPDTYP